MKSLVPQIEQWLRDRGAKFHIPKTLSDAGTNICHWNLPSPAQYNSLAEANVTVSEARYLYIANDPKPFIPPDWVNAKVMIAEPAQWQRALERITAETAAVYVRHLEHVPSEESFSAVKPLPEHIKLRLNVITE